MGDLKVVLDLDDTPGPNSGLGQFGQHLAGALVEQGGLRLICLQAATRPLPLPARAARRPALARSLVARWERPRVWHASHAGLPVPAEVPTLVTLHDLLAEQTDPRRLERLQAVVSRARGLAFVSETTRDLARSHLRWDDDLPTAVIHHGAQLEPPVSPNFLVPRRFLLTLGELRPRKNVAALIRMLVELPEFSLLIAGNRGIYRGHERELAELARESQVDARVVWCGPVTEGEKSWLYQRCEGLVMPSLAEGFGMPVVEAMSLGKPVFLARRTSLPEVGGPHASYWDDFHPAGMAAVVRQGLAAHRSEPVRAWAARFSWREAAAAYLRLYWRMAGSA